MSVKINRRIKNVAASMTLALAAKAKAMRSEGIDVIGLGAGEPDFNTPEPICDSAVEAIRAGETKYTPASGTQELKRAVREKLKKENGLDYAPEQIIISCGAKHTLYNIFMTLLDEGDEVIVPAPYWLSYPEQIAMAGGKMVALATSADSGYKITPDQLAGAITPRTAGFLLNSPSNPTGMVYTPDEIRALAAVLEDHPHLTIVSDEIYERLLYEGAEHLSLAAAGAALKDRTLVVNGMSKSFAMTGWRIGYCAGPKEFIQAMGRLQSHSTSNPTAFCQSASVTALGAGEAVIGPMREQFARRRKLMIEALGAIDGVRCPEPGGAFYVFPDVSALYPRLGVDGSIALCDLLLDKAKVSCVPGLPFGDDRSIRLSYATSPENITEGVGRIANLVGAAG